MAYVIAEPCMGPKTPPA